MSTNEELARRIVDRLAAEGLLAADEPASIQKALAAGTLTTKGWLGLLESAPTAPVEAARDNESTHA